MVRPFFFLSRSQQREPINVKSYTFLDSFFIYAAAY